MYTPYTGVHPFVFAALIALPAAAYAFPYAAHAGELHYGFIDDQKGDTLVLDYHSPAGAQFYTCDVSTTKCLSYGSTTPDIFPAVLGTKDYVKSADGTRAVKPFALTGKTYYFLYDLTTTPPAKLALIPYFTPGAKVRFSAEDNAVTFQDGTTFTRYDIASKKLSTLTLKQPLDFLQISPKGTYVTGYNYGTLTHEIWKFGDGSMVQGPSSMQSYLEWSEDESRFAYLDDVETFKTLFTMATKDLGTANAPVVQLTKPNTETEDYLFIGNTLYFLANVSDPSRYDLYTYDAKTNKSTLVEKDVSYGDYLKRIHTADDTYLAYLKTTGKNTDIVLVRPGRTNKLTFAPEGSSPADPTVTRTEASYGGRNGVLLASANMGTGSHDLFIWMHGGPQRQVSLGYHPYLSYAVYDELLERLAAAGNYVYKIDYTGSQGYGAAFRKALHMNIGKIEMADIKNAIADLKKDKKIDHVYLIGNSYGGYMALRGIVDMPKTVSGAISINGVTDWYGLISQIPSSPFKDLFNGVPDTTNLQAYFQASVFTGMENMTSKNKVLVLYGEDDNEVPTWQSTQYVDYAKAKGVDVKLVSFPGEEHILRNRTTLDETCAAITSYFGLKGVTCHE
jgi:dienelactone hydrolase